MSPPGPGVERVINDHALRQHGVVVGVRERQPQRDRMQASRLWREGVLVGIRAAHDLRHTRQRRKVDDE